MKIDWYTKTVLTLICIFLGIIAFNSIKSAEATRLMAQPVDIIGIGGEPIYRAALPVKMQGE